MTDDLQDLLRAPVEKLALELKAWIDPDTPKHQAKLVRAILAMRNNNGGRILIGFDDNGRPVFDNAPKDVRSRYSKDKLQALVMTFASEPFEIDLQYPAVNDQEFVLVDVPAGFKSPVVTKAQLAHSGRPLVRENQVYVRTLRANHTPSTAEIGWKDWSTVLEKCFENREADIGRFIRRHVTVTALREIKGLMTDIESSDIRPMQPVQDFMDNCHGRLNEIVQERTLKLPPHGSMEVAVQVAPKIVGAPLDENSFRVLMANNPSYTGWPPWVDSRNFIDNSCRPYTYAGGWEAFIFTAESDVVPHLDFWRIDDAGEFYLYRALQDDIGGGARSPVPGQQLDFYIAILRVAETMAVGLKLAQTMVGSNEQILTFMYRWRGLKGRKLSSWANPSRYLSSERTSYEEVVEFVVEVPINTPVSALTGYVKLVIDALFQSFQGFSISEEVLSDAVARLFERRL